MSGLTSPINLGGQTDSGNAKPDTAPETSGKDESGAEKHAPPNPSNPEL